MVEKNNRALGYQGEDLAEIFLKDAGYKIIAKNFTVKGGEIDIIAFDDNFLVFIEVKNYTRQDYGLMVEKINFKKRRNIIYAAKQYIFKNKLENLNCRFDVITIFNRNGKAKLDLIKNAFWA